MWCEITWAPITGQAAVSVTFKWFLLEEDVDPWYEETTSFLTSDRAVTDDRVMQYVRERAAVVAEMYQRYTTLAARLGIEAGVRFPVG